MAYHLALDAHPDVGNNALRCRLLGLDDLEEFGAVGARSIGFIGRAEPPISSSSCSSRCARRLSAQLLVSADGPEAIARVAIFSGAAAGELEAAADACADGFITG